MTNSILRASLLTAAMIASAGCATTSRVVVNPNVKHAEYHTVYVVVHGDNSGDMDANLQREFMRHGLSVSVGSGDVMPAGTQLVVRYADNWRWDMAMYLRSLDVMVYDARSNVLLASGSWKNSVMHGFYGSEKVVAKVVDQTLTQIGLPSAQ